MKASPDAVARCRPDEVVTDLARIVQFAVALFVDVAVIGTIVSGVVLWRRTRQPALSA